MNAHATEPRAVDLVAFADSFFAPYVDGSASPSLGVTIVRRNEVLLARGYGYEDEELTRRVEVDSTVFHMASLSKIVTALAIARSARDGRLSLNESIDAYLPGILPPRKDEPPITLWHLLTHTSGVEGAFMRGVVATPAELIPLDSYFRKYPPRRGRAPATQILYSNTGVALAGLVLESTDGRSFADVVREDVLEPLGMMRSSFEQPPPPELERRIATAGSGPVPDVLLLHPVGAMTSTVSDMGRLMQGLLRAAAPAGSDQVAAAGEPMLIRQWSTHPLLPGVTLGMFETELEGVRGVFHTGARVHFSLLLLLPEHDLGIFIVHSMRQGGEYQHLRSEFARAFIRRYVGPSNDRLPPDSVRRNMRDYAGMYRPHILSSSTIERAAWLIMDTPVRVFAGGTLEMKIPGGPRLAFAPIDPDVFVVTEGPLRDLRLAFQRNAADRVEGMAISGATFDPVSFTRLRWYQRGAVHSGVLVAAFIVFGVTAVRWVAQLLMRRRRRDAYLDAGRGPQWPFHLAGSAALLAVASPLIVVLLVASHSGDDTAAEGLRSALRVGLALLTAAAFLTLPLLPITVTAWRRRYWSLSHRVWFTVLAVATVLALPLLACYRLLGFWL